MKKFFLVISLLFSFVFTGDASAATHGFELEAVACSKELYQQEDMYDVFEACRTDYLDGKLNDYILEENGDVEPGSLVLFVNKYIYGGTSEVDMYSTKIDSDYRYWKNNEYDGQEEFLSYVNEDDYPKNSRKKYWNAGLQNLGNKAFFSYGESKTKYSLNRNINLSLFGLILRDDVPAGTKLVLSYDSEYSRMLNGANDNLTDLNVTTKGITLRVVGDNSYLNEIKSNKYTIKREENKTPIVIGAEPKTTINEFLNNFENNDGMLHIYDKEGNEITDYNNYVGSYMKIKFIDNNEVKDELTIIVRGDFDGNGIVDMIDSMYIVNVILQNIEETYLILNIADIDKDTSISSADSAMVIQYILGIIPILNE